MSDAVNGSSGAVAVPLSGETSGSGARDYRVAEASDARREGLPPGSASTTRRRRIWRSVAGIERLFGRSGSAAVSSTVIQCGKNIFIQEAVVQQLANLKSELEGPNPTPIERLLAERASLCWFILNRYENAYVNADGWSIDQVDLQMRRKIDEAHSRFLSSLLTLAQVRKLALPTVQLNIAKNQVNVAGCDT